MVIAIDSLRGWMIRMGASLLGQRARSTEAPVMSEPINYLTIARKINNLLVDRNPQKDNPTKGYY